MNKIFNRQSILEIIRFGIVGTTAMVIHYGIYYILLPFMNMNIAYTIGYFLSFLCNFVMSSYFTFKVKPSWKRLIRFAGSHGINYFLHIILFNVFLWLGVHHLIAPPLVMLVAMLVQFTILRVVFTKWGKH